jgi:hypothetical protein
MDSSKREVLRKELLARVMADPEGVVDLVLSSMDQVETLTKRVEQLEDQLKKNSGNSSKPPSTDRGSSAKPKDRSLRGKSAKKSGGQKGHPGRTLKRVDNPDVTITHSLELCPVTGRALDESDVVGEIRRQVFDIGATQRHR